MSQQFNDVMWVAVGVGLVVAFGVVESAVKGWFQRRRDRRFVRRVREGVRYGQ